jgi:hypothetical protein
MSVLHLNLDPVEIRFRDKIRLATMRRDTLKKDNPGSDSVRWAEKYIKEYQELLQQHQRGEGV